MPNKTSVESQRFWKTFYDFTSYELLNVNWIAKQCTTDPMGTLFDEDTYCMDRAYTSIQFLEQVSWPCIIGNTAFSCFPQWLLVSLRLQWWHRFCLHRICLLPTYKALQNFSHISGKLQAKAKSQDLKFLDLLRQPLQNFKSLYVFRNVLWQYPYW